MTVAVLLLAVACPLFAETRSAHKVFAKWRNNQRVFSNVSLKQYRTLDEAFLRRFHRLVPSALRPQAGFLKLPRGLMSAEEQVALRDALAPLVARLDQPGNFLAYLKEQGFAGGELNQREKKAPFGDVSEKYREFLEALLSDEDEARERTALFAAANAFFEFCFVRKYARCRAMTRRPADHPLLRMMYANIWYHLSGVGWQHWHADALARLEKRAEAGDEIIYIAGGTDVYRLLTRGMTRLRVIDPMFPSQTKYYAEGWRFLVEPSGRGQDRIRFTLEKDGINLTLVRTSQRKTGEFPSGTLSDKSKRKLPKTETVWTVLDDEGKQAGEVVFERRFVEQDDFEKTRGRTFLVSFNELHYVSASDEAGWGLDPRKFPRSLNMVVKQLRRPVSRETMTNLDRMRNSQFYFIKLGTSIN